MSFSEGILKFKKATFAMACFWHPDALFGCTHGVLRTRVGYCGGVFPHPTYKNLGDHTEAVDIDYDPEKTSYSDLLSLFWKHHDPTARAKIQYQSAVFYRDTEEKKLVEESKSLQEKQTGKKVLTRIEPFSVFHNAEDYHQKYYLQTHHKSLYKSLGISSKDLVNSSVAAKLNGYVIGDGTADGFEADRESLGLSAENVEYVRKQMTHGKQHHC